MIPVSKQERKDLERVGLLRYRKTGHNPQDQNFTVTNRNGRSAAKTIYVTESYGILAFLGRWEALNLMLIWPNQLQRLKDQGVIKENQVQEWGTYNPRALAFIDRDGQCRVKKTYEIRQALGKTKKSEQRNSGSSERSSGTSERDLSNFTKMRAGNRRYKDNNNTKHNEADNSNENTNTEISMDAMEAAFTAGLNESFPVSSK